MKIINKKIIGLATLFLALFAGLTALADESAWFELNPSLESGFTGTVNNCNPLTVSNGSVAEYPDCSISCNSGYELKSNQCAKKSSSEGRGRTSNTVNTVTPSTTSTTPTSPTTFYFSTTMRLGSYAGEVLPLQQFLASQGYFADTLSGYFGQTTLLAVKAYQKANGLGDDGIVGAMTRAVLNRTQNPSVPSGSSAYNFGTKLLKNGSKGDAVKELQRFLNKALGLGLIEDGVLGPKTIGIIKQWQKSQGLKDDGIVGPQTKVKMLEVAKGFK